MDVVLGDHPVHGSPQPHLAIWLGSIVVSLLHTQLIEGIASLKWTAICAYNTACAKQARGTTKQSYLNTELCEEEVKTTESYRDDATRENQYDCSAIPSDGRSDLLSDKTCLYEPIRFAYNLYLGFDVKPQNIESLKGERHEMLKPEHIVEKTGEQSDLLMSIKTLVLLGLIDTTANYDVLACNDPPLSDSEKQPNVQSKVSNTIQNDDMTAPISGNKSFNESTRKHHVTFRTWKCKNGKRRRKLKKHALRQKRRQRCNKGKRCASYKIDNSVLSTEKRSSFQNSDRTVNAGDDTSDEICILPTCTTTKCVFKSSHNSDDHDHYESNIENNAICGSNVLISTGGHFQIDELSLIACTTMVDLRTKLIEECHLTKLNQRQMENEMENDFDEDKKSIKYTHDKNTKILRFLTWLPSDQLNVYLTDITASPVFQPMMSVIDRIAIGERVRPNESMRYEMLRLCSFRTYPTENKPFLTRFAKAGFYYASNGDEVVCYCCGKRVSNWKEEDDPMEIHRRVSPSCSFVINNSEVNVNNTPRPDEETQEGERRSEISDPDTTNPSCVTSSSEAGIPCPVATHRSPDAWKAENILNSPKKKVHDNSELLAMDALRSKGLDSTNGQLSPQADSANTSMHFMSLPAVVHQQKLTGANNNSPHNMSSYARSTHLVDQCTTDNPASSNTGPRSLSNPPSSENGLVQRDRPTTNIQTHHAVPQAKNIAREHSGHQATMSAEQLSTETSTPTQMPKHPRFATQTTRLASFNTCTSIAISPERASEAGLFYAGTADCTRCFHCGIGLRHWSADDDPWVEHARFSIECQFVCRKKGEEFVHLIRLALAYTENNPNPSAGQQTAVSPTSTVVTPVPTSASTGSNENLNNLFKTIAVASVKEMGYTDDIIQRAVTTVVNTIGREAISAERIMQQIFVIEDTTTANNGTSEHEATPVDVPSANGITRTTANGVTRTHRGEPVTATETMSIDQLSIHETPIETRSKRNIATKSGNSSDSPRRPAKPDADGTRSRRRKLKKEIEAMKMMSICSKCRSKDVCIVFLPCGHLITCEDCAPSIRKCTQCGQVIKGTVRTYRS